MSRFDFPKPPPYRSRIQPETDGNIFEPAGAIGELIGRRLNFQDGPPRRVGAVVLVVARFAAGDTMTAGVWTLAPEDRKSGSDITERHNQIMQAILGSGEMSRLQRSKISQPLHPGYVWPVRDSETGPARYVTLLTDQLEGAHRAYIAEALGAGRLLEDHTVFFPSGDASHRLPS